MAVFEYRGIVATSGKQVHGVRDADNAKVLRAVLKREGVLLTSAHEEVKGRGARRRVGRDGSCSSAASAAEDVAMMTRQLATLVTRGHPAGRGGGRAHRAGREARAQARPHAGRRPPQRGQLARQGARGRTRTSSRTST